MDIKRPPQKQSPRKLIWIGAVTLIVAMALAIFHFEFLKHHRTYITITRDGRALHALVDRPSGLHDKTSIVILVHEVYGLSGWAKDMADELADHGFIVIAPDMLTGLGPKGGGYDDFASETNVVEAVRDLDPDIVTADLDSAVDYGRSLPSFNGKVAVVGFSWGGSKSFSFATHRRDLSAVFVFYGTGPADTSQIGAPVYGFYAGNDGAVTDTVPDTTGLMKAAGKIFEPITYEGADHGFMRLGKGLGSSSANKAARNQSLTRLLERLAKMPLPFTSPSNP